MTDHLLAFNNIKNLKSLLKPIPTKVAWKMHKIFNERAFQLNEIISKGFNDFENDDFELHCFINTNSPFQIYAEYGGGCQYGVHIIDEQGSSLCEESEIEVLSGYKFPINIEITAIVFKQKIGDFSSLFSFKNDIL